MSNSYGRSGALRAAGATTALLLILGAPLAAQDEEALRSVLEGQRVTLRIDMPGTSDGVDIRPDSRRPMDVGRYRNDLRKYGVAIRAGDRVVVTLVKVKSDHIEFQLGGGGFGTFWDDTSTSVYIPLVEKSEREKRLEREVREEDDRRRRRELQRELDDLRDRREAENRRIMAARARAEELKHDRIAAERLRGGSRFNLRYEGTIPPGVRAEDVMVALSEYVDFGPLDDRVAALPDAPGGEVLPHKGMLRAEAERAFGRPVDSSNRHVGELVITTLVFAVGGQQIAADFVDDVMVRYTITSK